MKYSISLVIPEGHHALIPDAKNLSAVCPNPESSFRKGLFAANALRAYGVSDKHYAHTLSMRHPAALSNSGELIWRELMV